MVKEERLALSERELRDAQYRLRQLALRIAGLRREGHDTLQATTVLQTLKATVERMCHTHDRLCAELAGEARSKNV